VWVSWIPAIDVAAYEIGLIYIKVLLLRNRA
jgi:hypothetical protein